jgi:hypothetical protein
MMLWTAPMLQQRQKVLARVPTFGGIGFSAKNAHRKVLLLNKAGA